GEALVEGLDELLFRLGEIGGVVGDLAFLLGGIDQGLTAEILRRGRRSDRRRGDAGRGADGELPAGDATGHGRLSFCVLFFNSCPRRNCPRRRATGSARRRSPPRARPSAQG